MDLKERAAQLVRDRRPFVHATVVRAQPPTSSHTGDEAILLQDGTIEGFVGGQCAQNSVRTAALGVLDSNKSVLLRILPDGAVQFPEAPGASVVVNPCLSGGAMEIFLEPQLPPPLVRIYGTTPIAQALARIAELLEFSVEHDDAGLERFSGTTAVVLAGHGGPEAEVIRAALHAGVGYVGLVASRSRGGAILDALELTEPERARVHTPVGLDIGARTSAEIAVSIAAELVHELRTAGLRAPEHDSAVRDTVREAIDPVCGMSVVVGPDTAHLRRGGDDFWFCGPGCRASFARETGARGTGAQ
ncbi:MULTISPECIES: XdhC family protein [unclassified Rhodococcus (in: high G+C Gram-positive bacteria)]|uniref:XdhC family protein n=1 Tax=unclassified Rhodococcus (in: high G+C Gram-positive bacteria) TaxID=192944 RepID=UPI00163A000F|nr:MULTISPECIES: XdhC family protein [unclassified Rhodococcus (in: high G+C Gram-positive bacteria)]MBC2642565.1 XdhC family protein [Rhodococcus sp. 3A]MBC2892693.1 XdhC family protein [Rhodococcus sp. 4CII]